MVSTNWQKLSAVQNHYSLLNRSSEESGILKYCKDNNIYFFSYMILEQGALTGKYDTKNPMQKILKEEKFIIQF